jgi:hypothetical protein
MAFPIEAIPDHDRLFRHVPNNPRDFWVQEQNRPSSAAFKGDRNNSERRFRASVDWEKYKGAEACRRSNSMAIVSVTPSQCRSVGKAVEHTPIDEENLKNQAHSDICDPVGSPMTPGQNAETSTRLAILCSVAWRLEER